MSYQVIARKWRPQKFDDVVGQQAVTRTLRNALASGRLAQAFVFAGPRGVGKTTTARILARALSCINGPTADPCGTCDACVEIAEGRDMDVLEIDAATHTGIDNVREVIIAGLGIMPVRNRYKVFIIDEVHQLSSHSFNSLLKSIEEPPPHVIFMMATTELDKIPDTVLSRSQVYEFRTISTKAIAQQLHHIMDAEGITVGEESLQLIARDAEGSMRDAQSKLDQVIAFTGKTIAPDDVATVLGLVGRDLLLDTLQAVADEDAPASFALAARAMEMGYDLRAVCRELSRLVRDVLVIAVDPSRISDPEIAGEGERDRLKALVGRFSREDLLRAFDLLTRTEQEIRSAAQPRYHLEMALLRWIHLRKLVPIEDLIAGAGAGSGSSRTLPEPRATRPAPEPAPVVSDFSRTVAPSGNIKDAFLARVKAERAPAYGAVLAQATKIVFDRDSLVLTFSASKKMGPTFDKYQAFFNQVASEVAGRRVAVVADLSGVESSSAAAVAPAADSTPGAPKAPDTQSAEKKSALREQALADAGVQTMLEVFPAEIRDVEEL